MTRAETEAYRQRLMTLAYRLTSDMSELQHETLRGVGGEAGGGLSDVPTHLGDLGTDTFEEDLDLDLLGKEEDILAEVNAALARIEQGSFGRCERCRGEIARDRLRALPHTRYCLACARQAQGQAGR